MKDFLETWLCFPDWKSIWLLLHDEVCVFSLIFISLSFFFLPFLSLLFSSLPFPFDNNILWMMHKIQFPGKLWWDADEEGKEAGWDPDSYASLYRVLLLLQWFVYHILILLPMIITKLRQEWQTSFRRILKAEKKDACLCLDSCCVCTVRVQSSSTDSLLS